MLAGFLVGGGRGGRGWGRVPLKLDAQGQGGGNILDVERHGGWDALKIRQFFWTPYM